MISEVETGTDGELFKRIEFGRVVIRDEYSTWTSINLNILLSTCLPAQAV